MTVKITTVVFWVLTPCALVGGGYQRFDAILTSTYKTSTTTRKSTITDFLILLATHL